MDDDDIKSSLSTPARPPPHSALPPLRPRHRV